MVLEMKLLEHSTVESLSKDVPVGILGNAQLAHQFEE